MTKLTPPKRLRFCLAYHRPSNTNLVGEIMDDGRCRIDSHVGLSGWTFWEPEWIVANNPWKGCKSVDDQILGLSTDYS